MHKRWLLLKVEVWYWLECHYPWFSLPWRTTYLGGSAYARRHQAERDVMHQYKENIYGKKMICGWCHDPKYH